MSMICKVDEVTSIRDFFKTTKKYSVLITSEIIWMRIFYCGKRTENRNDSALRTVLLVYS
jgi:hypothetical protein